MLRPEQMSKVSVTGARSVMEPVVETMYDMRLVHITDYDGSWEGFEPGEPLPGSDETSSLLVTVRSIKSLLDIEGDDVDPEASPELSNATERLEEIRAEVNSLEDQRTECRERLRELDERRDRMKQFAGLGLDLDLLWGYDSLDVLVGEGDADEVRGALERSDSVEAFGVFDDEGIVAAFGYMNGDSSLTDTLVGVPFTAVDVPTEEGDPAAVIADIESEYGQVEAELEVLEDELEQLEEDSAAFLLALEEELAIDAEKYESPLRFATTERSFIVEGWVPTDSYEQFERDLQTAVDGRVEVAELMQAAHGTDDHLPETGSGSGRDESGRTGTGDSPAREPVATDGGTASGIQTVDDDPPVIQNNSGLVGPFELLTKAVDRPKYSEFDPTIIVFLTFPLFFGFMIGDIGYGLVYMAIGYYMSSRLDSQSLQMFGTIVVWMGLFTVAFGVLYGEILGLHFFEWFDMKPVIEKGLSGEERWARTWLVVAVLAGIVQLNLGYIFEFIEEYQLHGPGQAISGAGSWLLALNGLWVFILSKTFSNSKPDLLVGSDAVLNNGPLGFGFAGFSEVVGIAGGIAFLLGLGLLLVLPPRYEVVEFAVPLTHVLSHTRLMAVLLAKAGMALVANLLYWGVYEDSSGFHYLHAKTPEDGVPTDGDLIFSGIANFGSVPVEVGPLSLGLEGIILGLPVFIFAHILVLAIGGSAAIQAIRLEFFEFFEKFYEGGGKKYKPFGYDRTYTTSNQTQSTA
jgi:V/A-type H+-transporting ATPase subunit I